MKFLLKGLLTLALMLTPATAQDWAKAKLESSPRHLEWVTVSQDGP